MPPLPRQPFDKRADEDAEPWTVRDEAERLDRIATLITQASFVLAAGAVASAFSLKRHDQRIFVYGMALFCAATALAAGYSLLFHPMRHVTRAEQVTSLQAKIRGIGAG